MIPFDFHGLSARSSSHAFVILWHIFVLESSNIRPLLSVQMAMPVAHVPGEMYAEYQIVRCIRQEN